MLCVGAKCSDLGLNSDMMTYRYLNTSGCLEVPGINDVKEFDDMMFFFFFFFFFFFSLSLFVFLFLLCI